jgi:DNA-binding response OmpR family regulator
VWTTEKLAERREIAGKACVNLQALVFAFDLQSGAEQAVHCNKEPALAESKARVLVVEDEQSIARGLCDVLSFRGYAVESAADGLSALNACSAQRFELLLLDVMLPELDGLRVCQQLRELGAQMPIVMLTAKGSEDDIVRGFEAGADDYVTKPFSVRELLARVHALLKRTKKATSECFRAGAFEIDPTRSHARCDGSEVALTKREVMILQLLAEDPGRIVSRRVLLREAWEMNNSAKVETRTVDMHIAKLRKKLGKRADGLVETVRGQGYRLWTGAR